MSENNYRATHIFFGRSLNKLLKNYYWLAVSLPADAPEGNCYIGTCPRRMVVLNSSKPFQLLWILVPPNSCPMFYNHKTNNTCLVDVFSGKPFFIPSKVLFLIHLPIFFLAWFSPLFTYQPLFCTDPKSTVTVLLHKLVFRCLPFHFLI